MITGCLGFEKMTNKSTQFKKGQIPWNKGKKTEVSDETRGKMSEAQKGRKHSEETKRKIAEAHRGKKRKPFSEEHRAKMSEAQRNKPPVTEETKRRMSLAQKGNGFKGENISYHGLHTWLIREKGKASLCSIADKTCKGRFEWANISHQYKRDLSDYVALCVSHHVRYDLKRKPHHDVRAVVESL